MVKYSLMYTNSHSDIIHSLKNQQTILLRLNTLGSVTHSHTRTQSCIDFKIINSPSNQNFAWYILDVNGMTEERKALNQTNKVEIL